jgi:hypothetical protein
MHASYSVSLTLLDHPNNTISSFICPNMFLFSNILSHVHTRSYLPVFLDASQKPVHEVRIFRRLLYAADMKKDPNLSNVQIFPPNDFSQLFGLLR